ncbi:MAG: hypothetical protein ACETWG_08155 [Candidatus Neomarinimicrobiota bacterium]
MIRAIMLGLALLVPCLSGQTPADYIVQGKDKIEAAVSGWDQGRMLEARAYFERVLAMGEQEWLLNYYIAYCDYRLCNHAFSINDKKAAGRFVNDGLKRLKSSTMENPEFGDAFALMSSLYGFKISLRPWTGFFYGPKAGQLIATALALAPDNPRVYLIQGTSQYYTPAVFGGGKELAKASFEKATMLFAREDVYPIMPAWGHCESYGWLGLTELDLGDSTSAKRHFDKALEIDPENSWVKDYLLPKLTPAESP